MQSPPALVFADEQAAPALLELLIARLAISADKGSTRLAKLDGSFLGFYNALSWYVGNSIREADIAALFDALNRSASNIGRG